MAKILPCQRLLAVSRPFRVLGTLQQEGVIDQDTRNILKADDLMSRFYTSPEGGAELFIAYFKTQRQGQSPHSPKNCLPGSGWQTVRKKRGASTFRWRAARININRYVVIKGEAQSVVYYWYQSQGRVIADEFAAKFYLVSDSIRHHRSDTALVRVVVPIRGSATQQAEKVGSISCRRFSRWSKPICRAVQLRRIWRNGSRPEPAHPFANLRQRLFRRAFARFDHAPWHSRIRPMESRRHRGSGRYRNPCAMLLRFRTSGSGSSG